MVQQYPPLGNYRDLLAKCVKCGACMAHCPVYRETGREGGVARGKLALATAMLNGEFNREDHPGEDFSLCLMCGSCLNKCPNKVPTDQIVGAVRRRLTAEKGLSTLGHAVSAVTGSKLLLASIAKGAALLSPALMKRLPETSGLRLRFPFPPMRDRTLPTPSFSSLFSQVPEFIQGKPGKATVGLFAGCSLSYLFPKTGLAMVDLLTRLGYSVYIPRNQQCCGLPALSSGNGGLAEELARKNRQAFAARDVDVIVAGCASCQGTTSEHYRTIDQHFSGFSDKIMDIHHFLVQEEVLDELAALPAMNPPRKVTYHDPCHLRTRGIIQPPRMVLQALPQVEFVEMSEADRCCGLGGTFSAHHYELSQAIGKRKMAGLLASGAECVATACPGCMIQLQDVINHAGARIRAVHIFDLVAEALQGAGDAKEK